MVYTSNFSSYRKYPVGYEPVSIAFYSHQTGMNLRTLWALTPTHKLLIDYKSGKVSQEEYKTIYLRQLEDLKDKIGIDAFQELNGLILLCYERSGDFCHRHLLADWLNQHGIETKEL